MNVFVLSTGRCGSTTFARACDHIQNYSTSHERKIDKLYKRVEYPDKHIEVDNRLSWFLGRLDKKYGDDAYYVHMKRDKMETAKSFSSQYERGIIKAYKKQILWRVDERSLADPLDVCKHYCDTINENINSFLNDKTNKMVFQLESSKDDFKNFWKQIGAEGNLVDALQEWDKKYNASNSEDMPNAQATASITVRAVKKTFRIIQELPKFLRRV